MLMLLRRMASLGVGEEEEEEEGDEDDGVGVDGVDDMDGVDGVDVVDVGVDGVDDDDGVGVDDDGGTTTGGGKNSNVTNISLITIAIPSITFSPMPYVDSAAKNLSNSNVGVTGVCGSIRKSSIRSMVTSVGCERRLVMDAWILMLFTNARWTCMGRV